jgi:L-2-hydroxyglutarate oxidase
VDEQRLPDRADVVVVGAGIVGLATARALTTARPGDSVLVLDKERSWARHQSGHNSGVIHAGIYYAPGSAKAALCREGRAQLTEWCDERGVPWTRCGKVVVASDHDERPRLDALATRAEANGVEVERIGPSGLADLEPHATGVAALHVPETGVVDFARVCDALVEELATRGVTVRVGCAVSSIVRRRDEIVVQTEDGSVACRKVANCAGLHSDRIAARSGDHPDLAIVPFRGEYHELAPHAADLVRALIYPVPDPRFPFLGVHLTRGIDGTVHAGPNAVLALAREGYRWRDVDRGDVQALARFRGTWRLGRRYWRDGAAEVARSISVRRTARALRRLVPELRAADLRPGGSGVRAQAVRRDGRLVDDFAFGGDDRVVHVLNAPSPAATASLAIGRVVAERLLPG